MRLLNSGVCFVQGFWLLVFITPVVLFFAFIYVLTLFLDIDDSV